MKVVFVHGWSVRHTDTYAALPARIEAELAQRTNSQVSVEEIYLGEYVSFDDAVTLDDVAQAFESARRERGLDQFAVVTHSTGGPILRHWYDRYFRDSATPCPLTHLVMLAPATHGSALAQLGKSRISRLKHWTDGVEPGVRILDWLELGSEEQWELNRRWLDFNSPRPFLFALTGQRIDRQVYDHLNSYTGEPGSDGVVRVAAANPNYAYVRLEQTRGSGLLVLAESRRTNPQAFGILPRRSHGGSRFGIMNSVTPVATESHPTVEWVTRCLLVKNASDYENVRTNLEAITAFTQRAEAVERVDRLIGSATYHTSRYSQLVFRVLDTRGRLLEDFGLLLTAGPDYSPDELPQGFCVDRQRNKRHPGRLTYYVDHDRLKDLEKAPLNGHLGFRLIARPQSGLAYYAAAEFRSNTGGVSRLLRQNETLMVEIIMDRLIDQQVFYLNPDRKPRQIGSRPSGRIAA